jgi:hypothetical protein
MLRRTPSVSDLQQWNIWLAALYALEAISVLVVGSSQLFSLSSAFVNIDSVQSTSSGSFVLSPATHHVFNLNILHVVFVVFLVLAAVHASQASWHRRRYEAQLKQNHNAGRWLAYGATASLLFLVLAVMAGAYDVMTLGLLLILGVLLHVLCVWVERIASIRGKQRDNVWLGYGLVVLAGAGMWLIVGSYLLNANLYGNGHLPARVYWLALTAGLTALCFAFGLYRHIRLPKTGGRYLLSEQRYMILTVVTTSVLVWQIVAGTMQ